MPGLFSQISSALSGGDTKLVGQIEEFANGYVIQGEVARTLGLKREESALLSALLAEELYRTYCSSHAKREPTPKALAQLEASRRAREAQVGSTGESLLRLEAALRSVTREMATLARQRGKYESSFASVDGLTEFLVSEAIKLHAPEVRAAKRLL